jgi:cation channel sperm-associated protein 3
MSYGGSMGGSYAPSYDGTAGGFDAAGMSGMSILADPDQIPPEIRSALGAMGDESLAEHLVDMADMALAEEEPVAYRSPFHKMAHMIQASNAFNYVILSVVFLNIISISLETNAALSIAYSQLFEFGDAAYMAVYTLEFLLKLYATPVRYWRSGFNIFDFSLLLLAYVQFLARVLGFSKLVSNVTFLRMFRAIRAVRALRTASFVRGLQVIVTALLHTLASVMNLAVLIMLFTYVFGIAGYYFFGDADASHFGTLGVAFTSLFAYVTADGWRDLQSALDGTSLEAASRIFAVFFIFMAHFLFTQLFIGVVMQNLETAQAEDRAVQFVKKQAVVRRKKAALLSAQRQEYEELLADTISARNMSFRDVLQTVSGRLRHDDLTAMKSLVTNPVWLKTYQTTLGAHLDSMYRVQMLQWELIETLAEMGEFSLLKSVQHASAIE